MPEATTVWMVRLDRGQVEDDVRGTLELEPDAVVFTEAHTGFEHRIPITEMQRPKRVKGSPILMVSHAASGDVRRVAFYFSQPPPLRPPEPGSMSLPESGLGGRPAGPFGAFRRTSKRRHMRTNLGYLTTANAGHKAGDPSVGGRDRRADARRLNRYSVGWTDANLRPAGIVELHDARTQGEQRVVAALADAVAGVDPCPALAHDDGAGGNRLAAERLHAEALAHWNRGRSGTSRRPSCVP